MSDLENNLRRRFGDDLPSLPDSDQSPTLFPQLAGRGSCRDFTSAPVEPALIETLAALALCGPSKSDLQQCDIVIIDDAKLRARLNDLLAGQKWIAGAPDLIIFLADNHRQRRLHDLRGHPFANDHLDAFFNASVDAAITLSAFVIAAEAAGLGCCPISEIRNHSQAVSDLLGLPDHVFAIAGLALGWPSAKPPISPRLPLRATVHRNRYDDAGQVAAIEEYDARRDAQFPFARQRRPERFGTAASYGWSEDKARQYASPDRADFGNFIRSKGFNLE